ncbi:unnamed protein product [Didymodactylos carnosus]|uniref:G protein-activated inward rectifier potassium channel 3 n=1 Tax=Didymodactylos carnosus TaxID=1234261 RepID=A0A813Y846_9BILA|nr:unnamed protein product [Didymodactylos carnosus]CAF3666592.1 unnamed protein product [Didymodactylos carnosus]
MSSTTSQLIPSQTNNRIKNSNDSNNTTRHHHHRYSTYDFHTGYLHPLSPGLTNCNKTNLNNSANNRSNFNYYVTKASCANSSGIPASTTATKLQIRKSSAISLSVPWYRRTRGSLDKSDSLTQPQQQSKMSKDHLLNLNTSTGQEDEPQFTNEAAAVTMDEGTAELLNETSKNAKQCRENGYVGNTTSHMTRLQCTTKGTKALRLLGGKHDGKEKSEAQKLATRGNIQRRLLLKNGEVNISRFNIEKRRRQYLADIFTTLIDLKWRWALCLFTLGFCVSWLAFAIVWYLLMYAYGDFKEENFNNANYSACIYGVRSFAGAILFSIETQQTIGYGTRVVKETCYAAIIIMMLQSSLGVMIQSFIVGVVFAKISRPKKRTETLIWSREAIISLRDGRLTLQCRVGDMRKSHIVEAHVRMYLIKKKVTKEGEVLPLHTYDMNVGFDKGIDRLFLIWPLIITHEIDEHSPLWDIGRNDLAKQRFELVVILEGIIESTGMTTQARTSYLPSEIVWGYRFERLITFQRNDGLYRIDYSRFNLIYPVDMITCSAKELKQLREMEKLHESAIGCTSDNNTSYNQE